MLVICIDGSEGENCEIDIDECASNPCENGGTCHQPDLNMYVCNCTDGSEGENCETDIDECASNPCHSGFCHDVLGGYTCACINGATGDHCEIEKDISTENNPAENGMSDLYLTLSFIYFLFFFFFFFCI